MAMSTEDCILLFIVWNYCVDAVDIKCSTLFEGLNCVVFSMII